MSEYRTLLEATRKELIDKSKNVDIVKRYKTTRLNRSKVIRIYDAVREFNKIDMNALFKASLLSFKVPVHGETDNYEVEILFDDICEKINEEIKRNKNALEYKCIYRAILGAIDNRDILVSCSCPDFTYRFSYWGTKGRYNAGKPELRPAKITNPNNSKGAGCKHLLRVLTNLDWALKLASAIFNYILYMFEHYPDKYERIIFPSIFGMGYEEAKRKGIIADDDLANTMDDNEIDKDEINKANKEGEKYIGGIKIKTWR